MRAGSRITTYAVYLLIIVQIPWCTTAKAGRHTFTVGDKMPEFSGTTLGGRTFSYKHNQNKALMVLFLSGGNKRSDRAAAEVKEIVRQLQTNSERLQVVIVVSDSNDFDFSSTKDSFENLHVLLDSEYKIWGKFGIIATPTVVISDTNDKVLGIKAGHGYDFVPVIRAYLNQALGLAQQEDPEKLNQVETVANNTIAARVKRHLQMAKILEQKNRIESAISEIQKALQLDPNSAEVALELGELLCKAGRSKEALETTQSFQVTKRIDKARLLLVTGWAKRQLDRLEEAEKFLLESSELDPKSPRTFFELGKVYQSRQQTDKAMKTYHKALALIFNEAGSITNSQ